jgi:phosphoribosylformimino-5-aminoimidazole carboxamide ribotide isomerase
VKDASDLDRVKELGKGKADLTIGSALDYFGGNIPYNNVMNSEQIYSTIDFFNSNNTPSYFL